MTAEPFGTTAHGEPVTRFRLAAGELSVAVLSCGAILQDVRLAGVPHALTAGSERLADYAGPLRYHGAVVGPVANRIAGASARIGPRLFRFEANEGPNTLHGGAVGTQGRVWEAVEAAPDRLTLRLALADGEAGFPGNRILTARYLVEPPARLSLTLDAVTDAPTPVNLANHSYWCLGGPGRGGMTLECPAPHYLPVDAGKLPTGEIAPVAGTRFDFARPRAVGGQGYDHCLCLAPARRALVPAARLRGHGLLLTLETTEPGLQVYDGNPDGVALEAQGWPDAPNRPGFPTVRLDPGETGRQVTRWSFARG